MYNKDVLDLYPQVTIGTKVTVTWESFGDGGGDFLSSSEQPRPTRARLREMQRGDLPTQAADRW
jgi:hypothetical protein